jgi:hypothetical protein
MGRAFVRPDACGFGYEGGLVDGIILSCFVLMKYDSLFFKKKPLGFCAWWCERVSVSRCEIRLPQAMPHGEDSVLGVQARIHTAQGPNTSRILRTHPACLGMGGPISRDLSDGLKRR